MEKPTGATILCRCGARVLAANIEYVSEDELATAILAWLHNGYTIEPRYGDIWEEKISKCICHKNMKYPNAKQ